MLNWLPSKSLNSSKNDYSSYEYWSQVHIIRSHDMSLFASAFIRNIKLRWKILCESPELSTDSTIFQLEKLTISLFHRISIRKWPFWWNFNNKNWNVHKNIIDYIINCPRWLTLNEQSKYQKINQFLIKIIFVPRIFLNFIIEHEYSIPLCVSDCILLCKRANNIRILGGTLCDFI